MSTGRWSKRGRVFHGRAKAVWALAGSTVADIPVHRGWVIKSFSKTWVTEKEFRSVITVNQSAVWIADNEVEQ
jgi:hypothetical protein